MGDLLEELLPTWLAFVLEIAAADVEDTLLDTARIDSATSGMALLTAMLPDSSVGPRASASIGISISVFVILVELMPTACRKSRIRLLCVQGDLPTPNLPVI